MILELKRTALLFAQFVVGILIVLGAGDVLHDELLRPGRSTIVVGGAFIVLVIGAVIVPGAGGLIIESSKKVLVLVRDGRRATDLKLAELEIPPPDGK